MADVKFVNQFYTIEERQEYQRRILELSQRGSTVKDIVALTGLSERTVGRVRRNAGYAKPKVLPMSADELAKAKSLLEEGCSYNEVSRTLGRHETAIRTRFPGMGVDRKRGAELRSMYKALRAI